MVTELTEERGYATINMASLTEKEREQIAVVSLTKWDLVHLSLHSRKDKIIGYLRTQTLGKAQKRKFWLQMSFNLIHFILFSRQP